MHESDLLAHAYSDSCSDKIESSLSQMEPNSITVRWSDACLITFLLFQRRVKPPWNFRAPNPRSNFNKKTLEFESRKVSRGQY